MHEPTQRGQCRACAHFRNDPKYLETVFSGLTSLSSGYGSVRADNGICLRHDRYLSARASCPQFTARAALPPQGEASPRSAA